MGGVLSYAPMSFTMTAMRRPCSLRRMCWRRVVFPDPWKMLAMLAIIAFGIDQIDRNLPGSPRVRSLAESEESVIVSS
jgi:hypothetical protein